MHAAASILFAFLFLSQAMVPNMNLFCELEKLPNLFEHFEEHEQQDGISLLDFLDFHYGSGQQSPAHHHNDEHDDQLPFHGNHQCCHTFVVFTAEQQLLLTALKLSTKIKFGQYSFSTASEYLETFFQPPKA